ncbi:hypothetical protein [Metabacillus fastidiosus]|uniref:hypothetical protein n=1 Tax=Metabacillus fastidiosus TaxID=1458 RepID=UPI003D2E6409
MLREPLENIQGITVVKQVTSQPDTFVVEGSKIPLDADLFDFPTDVYPLRVNDRYYVMPIVTVTAKQRWAILQKLTGGVTIGTMVSPSSVQVSGVSRAFGGSELILPSYPLIPGDKVSLAPTWDISEGKVKYVILEKH